MILKVKFRDEEEAREILLEKGWEFSFYLFPSSSENSINRFILLKDNIGQDKIDIILALFAKINEVDDNIEEIIVFSDDNNIEIFNCFKLGYKCIGLQLDYNYKDAYDATNKMICDFILEKI